MQIHIIAIIISSKAPVALRLGLVEESTEIHGGFTQKIGKSPQHVAMWFVCFCTVFLVDFLFEVLLSKKSRYDCNDHVDRCKLASGIVLIKEEVYSLEQKRKRYE